MKKHEPRSWPVFKPYKHWEQTKGKVQKVGKGEGSPSGEHLAHSFQSSSNVN